ncbi:hypothetical protein Scep_019192 [Stephania cephalantha]|uniref:Uncharacterized protein n=1 Tax=Stephania cephalantha TaxID=152367 RepID=A0AAP0IAE4_9MAGN
MENDHTVWARRGEGEKRKNGAVESASWSCTYGARMDYVGRRAHYKEKIHTKGQSCGGAVTLHT